MILTLHGLDGIPKDEFFTINTNVTRGNIWT